MAMSASRRYQPNLYQGEVSMAFDAYIQIAEITGEALDEQYANWIEIIGY